MEYELRPMAAEFSSLASCDGSARLRCGETDVIVGVQGPRPPRAVRFEDATGCLIEVMLQPAYGQMGELARFSDPVGGAMSRRFSLHPFACPPLLFPSRLERERDGGACS